MGIAAACSILEPQELLPTVLDVMLVVPGLLWIGHNLDSHTIPSRYLSEIRIFVLAAL